MFFHDQTKWVKPETGVKNGNVFKDQVNFLKQNGQWKPETSSILKSDEVLMFRAFTSGSPQDVQITSRNISSVQQGIRVYEKEGENLVLKAVVDLVGTPDSTPYKIYTLKTGVETFIAFKAYTTTQGEYLYEYLRFENNNFITDIVEIDQLRFAHWRYPIAYSSALVSIPLKLPNSVTWLHSAFHGCATFNQDLSSLDVSKVKIFDYLLYQATGFNADLSGWDTTKATSWSNWRLGCSIVQAHWPKRFNF